DGSDNNAAPGVYVHAGDPIRWTYEVTNTGNVPLTNARDDGREESQICRIAALAIGDLYTDCTVPDGAALKGQQKSTAFAKGVYPVVIADGTSTNVDVKAQDDEYYFGADPQVSIVKRTNGTDNKVPPGVTVHAGDAIRWTFEVKNTGNVALT